MCESSRLGLTCSLPMVVGFDPCWRDVPDRLQQALVIEPVNPRQCGQFHRFALFHD